MWRVGRYWINPLAITNVEDGETWLTPHRTEDGKIAEIFVYLDGSRRIPFRGEERQVLLAYLSQHTTMHPPSLVEDDDEPPF